MRDIQSILPSNDEAKKHQERQVCEDIFGQELRIKFDSEINLSILFGLELFFQSVSYTPE